MIPVTKRSWPWPHCHLYSITAPCSSTPNMNLLYTSRLRPSFLAFVRRIRIALFASRPPMVERRTPSSESLSDSASHVGSVNSSGITITIHGDEESRPSAQGNASFTTVNTGFNSQTDIHEHSTTILSLSREDLVSIFLEVSRPSRRTGCRLSPGAVLSLGAVCREWRRALLHTAEVWGQLLDIDRNSLECFQTFIERSDDSPIYLFSRQILETTSEERLAVWEVALAHLSRCVEFQIEYPSDVGDRVDLRPILDIFYRPYQPLHFTVSASSTRNTLISIVSSSNHDTGRDVHFQVADWVMPWNLSAPCFHSTTELVVELENSRPLESMELWISVLHNLPNLRGLTLVDCIHIPPYVRSDTLKTCEDCNGSVTLLHLEHLKLCGNFQIFALLFQHLDVPMACSFHFDLQVQTNPIILHDIHHSTDETDRVEPLFHVFAIFLRTPRESGFDQWILNVGKSLLSIEAKSVSATEYSIFKFAIDNDFAVGLQARIISQCLLHLANPDSGFEPVTQVALSLHDDNVPSEVVKGLHAHLSQMQGLSSTTPRRRKSPSTIA
ncbi:hypothetical protein CC2G_013400 [Coprinopsis cinerea AmutBmut pab1-1]|nr:hypothetical protein CC2G_013400 [Coprinopsis cinerea AmutBmut pab1-1]